MKQRYRPCGADSCCYTDDRNTVNSFRDEAHKLRERIADQEEEIKRLRRGIDAIKVRSYELGHRVIHDMALALLSTGRDEG